MTDETKTPGVAEGTAICAGTYESSRNHDASTGETPERQPASGVPEKSLWNSLEIAKIIASLITPLAVVMIGYMISNSSKELDERRAQQIRDAETIRVRQSAVIELSRFIYNRRARAELLASGLRRHVSEPSDESKKEIIERKRDYDIVYADWNTNSQAILLRVRATLSSPSYSFLEHVIERRLIGQAFAPLDGCLTRAYDLTVRGGDPRSGMQECKANDLIQRILDCGYTITNSLYLAASTVTPRDISEDRELRNDVECRCPDIEN
jgi:hypothetical protein